MNQLFAAALPGFLGGLVGSYVMVTFLHYLQPKPAPKKKQARKPRSKTVERSEPEARSAAPLADDDLPWKGSPDL